MKKILALLLSVVTMFACFSGVACGGVSEDQKKNALIIEYYKAGYGGDWITNLANEYQKRTGQEVVLIPRSGNEGLSTMSTELQSGTSETDLFFTSEPDFAGIYRGKAEAGGKIYDSLYADLTDLYNSTIEGENITVKDKMFDSFEEYYKMPNDSGKYYSNKYYFFPYVTGMLGIVVNTELWNSLLGANTPYPRTTDELLEICNTVKANKAPFIYSLGDEYWTSSLQIFFCQYEGVERMDKFYQGYCPNGEDRYDTNMVAYDGFKKSLEFYAELLKPENNYMHPQSKSYSFMQMQGSFLLGEALFNVNGDWLEREMITKYPNAKIAMMKTPVLSAVKDKCATIADDTTLRSVIDYVDGTTATKPSGVSDADIETVRKARSVEYVTGAGTTAHVPSYANQIESAKNFLRFMASDEGMIIFRNGTNGCELPFNYTDTSKAVNPNTSTFRQSINNVLSKSEARFTNRKDRIFTLGGINIHLFNNKNGRFVKMFTNAEATRMTAQQYFEAEVAAVNSMLTDAKKSAGIL